MKTKSVLDDEDKVDLTPMIDIVFLLLVYFMVTMQLIKEEADLGMQLPALSSPSESNDIPEEAYVEVLPDSTVRLNGAPVDISNDPTMPELKRTLTRLNQAAVRAGVTFFVTIAADPDSLHDRSIDVLNACAAAKIKMVSFANVAAE